MKKNMVIITSIIAFMIVATVVTLMIMAGTSNVQKQTRFLMDTYVTIQVPGKKDVLPAIAKALDKMEKVDVQFNALNEKSQVYAFNNSNKPIDDPEIVYLTKESLKISENSDVDYDITLHEL
jgi:thiamine biosynthesis lipoprotein ApbE